jgi:A/G-specific adenine glycosylase
MARRLEQDFGGGVPVERGALLSLPGVSDYVAGATRCFAWNLPEALIDTNTVRVAGRLFGLEVRDSSRRNRLFRSLLEALVDREEPRAYNYALLDLADRICMKRRPPQHGECPLLPFCVTGGKTTGAEN